MKRYRHLADQIYMAIFGQVVDHWHYEAHLADIMQWLSDGEPITTEPVDQLAREYQTYVAENGEPESVTSLPH